MVVDGPEQAVEVANLIAPEHLELLCRTRPRWSPGVRHAGRVFCGPWAPASVGDYIAGPSHVLPTDGSARFGSALTVDDFTKHLHVITLDRAALREVGPHVEALATAEGLDAPRGLDPGACGRRASPEPSGGGCGGPSASA